MVEGQPGRIRDPQAVGYKVHALKIQETSCMVDFGDTLLPNALNKAGGQCNNLHPCNLCAVRSSTMRELAIQIEDTG